MLMIMVFWVFLFLFFFFSSRRRHTRSLRDWSSDVCSSDLGEPACAQQPVEHARALEAVHGAELEVPDRQVAVRAGVTLVDQNVERAVHGLGVVLRALQLHGRIHPVGKEDKMPAGLPEVRPREV